MQILKYLEAAGCPIKDGKIVLPEGTKHIKLDVGLSYSAPQTQEWLSNESNLVVFGFEPNPEAVACILNPENKKKHPLHGEVLEHKWIGKQAFILPVALGQKANTSIPFYVTGGDEGCSSMFMPNFNVFQGNIKMDKIIEVPVVTLKEFFDVLPFETIPYVEYIKVDAQGADLDIIKGLGSYLSERVVYITMEADGRFYHDTNNSIEAMIDYMTANGFHRIGHFGTSDPTFLNTRYEDKAASIYIRQL